MLSSPGPPSSVSGAVAGAQDVVAAARRRSWRRADLAAARILVGPSVPVNVPADVELDLLDVADVVALAGAPVVGAAAERDRDGRVAVVKRLA